MIVHTAECISRLQYGLIQHNVSSEKETGNGHSTQTDAQILLAFRKELPMPRAPYQVLVLPYRRTNAGEFEYALFQRANEGFWQFIAGGGEDDETPLQAARRETWEEARIPTGCQFLPL